MPRRFQFSLGRLVVILLLCSIAGGLWRQSFPDSDSLLVFNPFAFAGFVVAVAAAIGTLFQRVIVCVFIAYLGLILAASVVLRCSSDRNSNRVSSTVVTTAN